MATIVRKYVLGTPPEGEAGNEFVFRAADATVDRVGDRVFIAGMDTAEFERNPIMLAGHDSSALPVGFWKVWKDGNGADMALMASPVFSASNPLGIQMKGQVAEGSLRTVSVGFTSRNPKPNAYGGLDHTNTKLMEVSFVALPCNPNTVRVKELPEEPPAEDKPAEPTLADVMAALAALAEKVAALSEKAAEPAKEYAPAPEEEKPEKPDDEQDAMKAFCAMFNA